MASSFLLVLLLLIGGFFENDRIADADVFPFRNVSLDWPVRVDDLVSRLTAHEIIDQMAYAGGWDAGVTPPIPRLNILPYSWGTECLRGDVSENSTGFPQAISLAATWNKQMLHAVANATAYEVHAHYNVFSKEGLYGVHRGLSCFSPVVNIMRHPLWGRGQETYGECPYLTGMFAIFFIHGLQGPPTARYLNTNAGCKHFDSHNGPENIPSSRFSFNAQLSEYDWRSTFLPAFQACVNAGSYGIMCSYNSINGVPSCANTRLLTDILRREMNFTGYVVADDDALVFLNIEHHYVNTNEEAAIVAVQAGVNLELADSPGGTMFELLHQAYDEGKVNNQTLIERVKPLMYTRMRLGEFDPPEMNAYNQIPMDVIQSDAHRMLARQAAVQSFVLLKNENNFLPIREPNVYRNVLFLGPMSNNPMQQYGDYFPIIDPYYVTTPLSALQDSFVNSSYNEACLDGTKCLKYNQTEIVSYLQANTFDLIILSVGTGPDLESEGNDRVSFALPNNQSQLLDDVLNTINPARTKVLLLTISGTPMDIHTAHVSDAVPGIIHVGFAAQELGEALKSAIIGNGLSQFGRLPFTWPKQQSDLPGDLTKYDMTSGFTYRYSRAEPLYPFGFGLSYSTFAYHALGFNTTLVRPGAGLLIDFYVQNTGEYVSDEVVQIYLSIHLKNASLTNVTRAQLVDFNRLTNINPQMTVYYRAAIRPEQMAVYVDGQGFLIVPATLEFRVGCFTQPYLSGNVTLDGPTHYVGQYISYAAL